MYRYIRLLCQGIVQDCIAQMVEHADEDDITFHFTDSGSSPTIDSIFFYFLFIMYPIDSLSFLII